MNGKTIQNDLNLGDPVEGAEHLVSADPTIYYDDSDLVVKQEPDTSPNYVTNDDEVTETSNLKTLIMTDEGEGQDLLEITDIKQEVDDVDEDTIHSISVIDSLPPVWFPEESQIKLERVTEHCDSYSLTPSLQGNQNAENQDQFICNSAILEHDNVTFHEQNVSGFQLEVERDDDVTVPFLSNKDSQKVLSNPVDGRKMRNGYHLTRRRRKAKTCVDQNASSSKSRQQKSDDIKNQNSHSQDKSEEKTYGRRVDESSGACVRKQTQNRRGRKPKVKSVSRKAENDGSVRKNDKMCTNENRFQCVRCEKTFKTNGQLKVHLKAYKDKKMCGRRYECSLCEEVYDQKCLMQKHMMLLHGVAYTGRKPHRCTLCERIFCEKGKLEEHMRTHTGERPFKCTVCPKDFTRKYDLDAHMRIHGGHRPHECTVCNKRFFKKYDVKTHMRIHTGDKPYLCSMCSQSYRLSSSLAAHMLTHTDEKPFECDICHKHFRRNSHLKAHIRIHTGEKPYQCSVCAKVFTEYSTWYKHKEIHTEGQSSQEYKLSHPYICTFCGRAFRLERKLQNHMRTHTGEKPFECTLCEKRFRMKDFMMKHMKVHTGERPFKCSVCFKGFAENIKLKYHMRTHTGEKPYKCPICYRCFTFKCVRDKHLVVHAKK